MSGSPEKRLTSAVLRLKAAQPCFATLSLFAPIQFSERFSSAATDGVTLFFNPHFVETLSSEELLGLLSHEILHMALLHVPRKGDRESTLWNIACDIVVNGMVRASGFLLPEGGVECRELEHLPVEQVYARLERQTRDDLLALRLLDLAYESFRKSRVTQFRYSHIAGAMAGSAVASKVRCFR